MIEVIKEANKLIKSRKELSNSQLSIGLVPTMGNLHQGHLSLIDKCLNDNDVCVISIFVNPLQFGPSEDYHKYPRTLDIDLDRIDSISKKYNKKIIVFAPASMDQIFPDSFSTTISLGPLTKLYCGKNRPGHFDGVTTVVYKLFSLIRPHRGYFGEKDIQQLYLIKKMVQDLDLNIDIIGMPIVRDYDGLALSSRNQYIPNSERAKALKLVNALNLLAKKIRMKEFLPGSIGLHQFINEKVQDKGWDYLEVIQKDSFGTAQEGDTNLAIIGAFNVNSTRLIDNIHLKLEN